MPSETYEAVENFLKDVDEQISCKLGLESVNEELRGHIEDKAFLYMEYGLEEKEAYKRSVRDMGAADVIGMELNKHHRLRLAKPLLILILLLMAVGITGGILEQQEAISEFGPFFAVEANFYYLWALAVMLVLMFRGYPLLLKHTKLVCGLFLAILLSVAVLYLGILLPDGWDRILPLGGIWPGIFLGKAWSLVSSSAYFGVMQLAVPVGAVLFYRRRHQGYRAFLLFFCYQAVAVLCANLRFWNDRYYISVLILLLGCFGVSLYVAGRGWIGLPKKKGAAAALLSFCALLVLWAAPNWNQLRNSWEIFVNPGERASVTNAWDDSYNNVLIRDLLSRARAFGEIELTDEELMCYRTSQWYYEDGEGSWNYAQDSSMDFLDFEQHVETRSHNLTHEPTLRDILPQYYMENYRISWWALAYGWVPALLLTLLCLALPALAWRTALSIRNPLGRLTALAGALVLAIQTVFYIVGCLGCQFGGFSNLPFVSEGVASLTGSAVLAGLILSAYRYDTVTAEPLLATSSDSGRQEDKHREIQE